MVLPQPVPMPAPAQNPTLKDVLDALRGLRREVDGLRLDVREGFEPKSRTEIVSSGGCVINGTGVVVRNITPVACSPVSEMGANAKANAKKIPSWWARSLESVLPTPRPYTPTQRDLERSFEGRQHY